MNVWDGGFVSTYVKLAEGTDVEEFQSQIRLLPHQYIGEELAEKKTELTLNLQSLRDVHLYSHRKWELEPPGNPMYVHIFSAVGILILLIACMNFMNLSTARSANRACEVGVRKVIGAGRRQLIWQFLCESFIITGIALAVALLIADVAMPYYNDLTGLKLTSQSLLSSTMGLTLAGLIFFIGIAAGSYPAFVLSSFKPVSVFKATLRSGSKGAIMRKVLVVGQFSLSIALIIGTIVLFQQIRYMKNQPLGFDKEQKLIINMDLGALNPDNMAMVKNEFRQHPSIKGAAVSSSVPGRWLYWWGVWPAGEEVDNNHAMHFFQVDHDFIPEYNLQFVTGRAFQKDMSTDNSAVIMNVEAARTFGWTPEEALSKHIWSERVNVLGITENFHYEGLQDAVKPVIMFLIEDDFKYLTLSVDTANLDETLAFVQSRYRELFPDMAYEYFFLDEDFNRQYRFEDQVARIFGIFTSLGILIACLGLFGVAAYIAEQRTKEIGIRKVLGATVSGIVRLMTKEFVLLVLISTLIAAPLAYYAMNKYLQSFAYRVDLSFLVIVLAGALALVIAVLTVSYQAIKAATLDPVKSLRYE
jgi:putative ABC transport system permease protein